LRPPSFVAYNVFSTTDIIGNNIDFGKEDIEQELASEPSRLGDVMVTFKRLCVLSKADQ